MCIPYLTRNAILHAKKDTTTYSGGSESQAQSAVQDPYSYRIWTFDFVLHWSGSLPVQKGRPHPKDGYPIWAEFEKYSPGKCSEFADSGPWITSFPTEVSWILNHPPPTAPKIPAFSRTTPGGKAEVEELGVSLWRHPATLKRGINDGYFMGSPDPYLGVFYRDAACVVAGDAEYASISEPDPDAPKQRTRWGFTRLADHKSAHHFIGVINE